MDKGEIFRAEVRCTFPEWDRYDLYVTAVCFDEDGRMVDYVDLADKSGVLETIPCDHADIYIYVIANTFPASDVIAKSPPFDIEVVTRSGGDASRSTLHPVNQWGGLSVKQSLV